MHSCNEGPAPDSANAHKVYFEKNLFANANKERKIYMLGVTDTAEIRRQRNSELEGANFKV